MEQSGHRSQPDLYLRATVAGRVYVVPPEKPTCLGKGVYMKCYRVFFNKKKSSKISVNTYLSMIESNKQNKQVEQKQNHRHRKHFDGGQMGGGSGQWVKKVKDLRSTNR